MNTNTISTNLLIILITFIVAAFFVAAEFALVQTRPSQIEDLLAKHTGNQRKLTRSLHMVQRLNEYLSTTQVGTSLTGIILGWIGETTIEQLLVDFLGWTHFATGKTLNVLGAVIGVVLLTYLEVVLTEIVPKNISIDMPLRVLMAVVTPLYWFHMIFYPFVWLLNTSASGIVKLFGLKVASEENEVFSQSEILNLSKIAVSGGSLDKNDLLYMERAFDLNDRVAKDIMTDRTQLTVLDVSQTVHEALNVYLSEGYSRLLVTRDNDKDNLVGYVYAHDIVQQDQNDSSLGVSRILRALITVPESMPIHQILDLMIKKQTPIVVVVDEYGGTSGIVTDKDIYEELFGSVHDEIDDVSDEYIIKQADDTVKVSGKTTLYDFERYFHNKLNVFQESDIITLGGFFMENYPDLTVGTTTTIGPFDFKLTEIDHGFMNWFSVTKAERPLPRNAAETTADSNKAR
ncbi:hemolysin family protein [Lapidilactobacillus luobeiensis]|uniref:hemolysin family protein n=1 Tax=Lapidilactobacillus luobeiensis TaxID=2950371 RepID=UPI0021C39A45|nr:hemolysin family protein [Lapidilactobacillus luobeiensis]